MVQRGGNNVSQRECKKCHGTATTRRRTAERGVKQQPSARGSTLAEGATSSERTYTRTCKRTPPADSECRAQARATASQREKTNTASSTTPPATRVRHAREHAATAPRRENATRARDDSRPPQEAQ